MKSKLKVFYYRLSWTTKASLQPYPMSVQNIQTTPNLNQLAKKNLMHKIVIAKNKIYERCDSTTSLS